MSSNFLQLTNKILGPFNEVQLTASTFTSAVGFAAEAQNYVNQAIFDVYTYEDTKWPFLWGTTTFNTVIGQTDYTRVDSFSAVCWDRFKIQRGRATATSLTQVSGVATFTANSAHNFLTGDIINITGATPDGYNAPVTITVTSSTEFTFTCTTTLTSPATGTILATSATVLQSTLNEMAWNEYIDQRFWDTDQNTDSTGYGLPRYIVRKPDNNLYVGNQPADRVYAVYYEGYTIPAAMVSATDAHLVPVAFEQVIIDKAMHYAYMFRDNTDEAVLAQKRYEDNVVKMRRILIPQASFATASD